MMVDVCPHVKGCDKRGWVSTHILHSFIDALSWLKRHGSPPSQWSNQDATRASDSCQNCGSTKLSFQGYLEFSAKARGILDLMPSRISTTPPLGAGWHLDPLIDAG